MLQKAVHLRSTAFVLERLLPSANGIDPFETDVLVNSQSSAGPQGGAPVERPHGVDQHVTGGHGHRELVLIELWVLLPAP